MSTTFSLTEDSIEKLIIKISLPASIGFFFNTMYNVVDTYFGGKISTEALAALSLSFPVFFLIIAFGSGISSATTALIGHALGSGNKALARHYADQSFLFTIIFSILLTFIALGVSPELFKLLGAQGNYLSLALSYTNVIFFGTVFFMITFFTSAVLSATGDTKTYSKFLFVGFLLNIFLNPTLIYGWFGLPALGLSGVAWATFIVQIIGSIYLMYKVIKTDLVNRYLYKDLKPDWHIWKQIFVQAFPASLSMMTVAIGIFVITYFISSFSKEAVAAYGIATRIEQIALLPALGMNIAVLSLVAQNMGAKKIDRIRLTIKAATKYTMSVLGTGAFLVYVFASHLMSFFTKDMAVVEVGVKYLHIAVFIFFAYGFIFVSDSALRGLKKPIPSVVVGLCRQIAGPLIIFPIMISLFHQDIKGLWVGIALVTWTAALSSWFYTNRIIKHLD